MSQLETHKDNELTVSTGSTLSLHSITSTNTHDKTDTESVDNIGSTLIETDVAINFDVPYHNFFEKNVSFKKDVSRAKHYGLLALKASILENIRRFSEKNVFEYFEQKSEDFSYKSGIEWQKPIQEKIYSSRILDINNEYVKLEVLVDPKESIFKEKTFDRILFSDLLSSDVGGYVILRLLKRPGEARIQIIDGKGLIPPKEKELFEDYSEFDFLDNIETESIDLSKL